MSAKKPVKVRPVYHETPDLPESIRHFLKVAGNYSVDAFEISANVESGFTASARMGAVENLEHHCERRVTISVYQQQRSASASASDLSPVVLQQTLEKACSMVQYTQPDPCAGLADKALMANPCPELALSHPWDVTPQRAIDLSIACDQAALSLDPRITVDEASITTTSLHCAYANSHGFIGYYPATVHGISLSVVAQENGVMERDYDYCYNRNAADLLSPQQVAENAVTRTLRRLNARKISTRRCPVIFERRVAKSLIGHFVAAISGSSLYRKTSFLVDALGKKIFPNFVNIQQKPHLIAGPGSAPFDHQGVKTRDLSYVEDGVLTNYVLGNYSAKKLGLVTTGNAGGVFNLSIRQSCDRDLVALCRDMGSGLLVTELLGQGVNLLTGDYSRGAAGFWVENGEIQYPVHEITIAANLKEMFANLLFVGNDIDPRANLVTGSIGIAEMTVAGN